REERRQHREQTDERCGVPAVGWNLGDLPHDRIHRRRRGHRIARDDDHRHLHREGDEIPEAGAEPLSRLGHRAARGNARSEDDGHCRERQCERIWKPALEPVGQTNSHGGKRGADRAFRQRRHLASAFVSKGYLKAVSVETGRIKAAPTTGKRPPEGGHYVRSTRAACIMANLGYVGLGVMGGRMTDRLMSKGHVVTGTNRTKSKAQWLIDRGMKWADTPRGVAEKADIVFSMVTDSAALEAIANGPDGIVAGLGPGKVLVDMSTVSPAASKALAERV